MPPEGQEKIAALPRLGEEFPSPNGLEGVAEMFDFWGAIFTRPCDRNDVKTRGTLEKSVTLEKSHGKPGKPPLLVQIDRLGGMAGVLGSSRFDFNENDGLTIERDKVEFARTEVIASRENFVAESA